MDNFKNLMQKWEMKNIYDPLAEEESEEKDDQLEELENEEI